MLVAQLHHPLQAGDQHLHGAPLTSCGTPPPVPAASGALPLLRELLQHLPERVAQGQQTGVHVGAHQADQYPHIRVRQWPVALPPARS